MVPSCKLASYCEVQKETHQHAVFDDELHQILLNGGQVALAWMLHQRHHKLQDLRHIADHHEVILRLQFNTNIIKHHFTERKFDECGITRPQIDEL